MMRQSNVNVNGSAGAQVIVRCTLGSTTKIYFQEDASANAGTQQGFIYSLLRPLIPGETGVITTTIPLDQAGTLGTFVVEATFQVPATQALVQQKIEGYPGDHPSNAASIGNGGSGTLPAAPGGPITLGTPIFQIRSLTATATKIVVSEWAA